MVELILIIIYSVLCLINDKRWIVGSLIILFPSHLFIKHMLELYLGHPTTIFPLWYDIAILILLLKSIIQQHYKIKYGTLLFLLILMLFFQFGVSYFANKPESDAIATLRIYLHCIILFITFSIINFNASDYHKINKIFIYSTIFYCITGIVIYSLFQQEFHLLLGHIEFTPNGMTYSSPSFLIMGYERMFGLVGGPNQFGVYLAFTILYLYYIRNYQNQQTYPFINLAIILSIICIILSFSRAGWAIVLMTLGCLNLINGNIYRTIGFIYKVIFLLCILLILIFMLMPEAYDIILSSLNGDESSAAARGDIVKSGFAEIAGNIFGHGLGTGIEENGSPISESSIVICLYELGIFVTIYYYALILIISHKIFKRKTIYSKILISFVLATIIVSIVSMNPFQYPYIYYFWSILGIASNNRNIQISKIKKI